MSFMMAAARPSGACVDQAETPFTPAASAAPPALAATSSLAGRAGSAIAALAKGSLSSSPRPGRHQSLDADLEAAYRTMVLLGGRGIV